MWVVLGAVAVPALAAIGEEGRQDGLVATLAHDVADGLGAGDEKGPVGEARLGDEEGAVGERATGGSEGCRGG